MVSAPIWVQYVIGVAAGATAFGTIWRLLIKPLADLISTMHELTPLLKNMAGAFARTPNPFDVLEEIISEFRTDSGSSLRDAIDKLTEQVALAKKVGLADRLASDTQAADQAITSETARKLSIDDRAKIDAITNAIAELVGHIDPPSPPTPLRGVS